MADGEVMLTSHDDHLADLLIEVGFGADVRFDHLHQRWLYWDEVRWRPDQTRRVPDMIRDYGMKLVATADQRSEPGAFRKMVLPIFDTGKKEAILKSLSGRVGIAMSGNEWDQDGYLLGFENGILDLRTREFDDHPSSETYISKSTGYDWDPDAKSPLFDAFLVDILGGDLEMAKYLMTMLGYSLFGLQSEQKFWMWVGRGSNGKGILARTMLKTLGSYAMQPADTLYMKTRNGAAPSSAARPDLVKLQSIRFTVMSEPQGGQFNEEMLKAHTGEDIILARNLYDRAERMAEFPPTHKIVFLTNDPPKTDDTGVSMRRRARVVKFEKDYTGPRADMTLEGRIAEEKPGIMALLTKFAVGWWNDGDPTLAEPKKVFDWSEAYINENDPLGRFIEECCVLGEREKGQAAALWNSYEDWCARNNEEPKSHTGFGMALGRRYRKVRTETGYVYHGIRAKGVVEAADE